MGWFFIGDETQGTVASLVLCPEAAVGVLNLKT